MLFDLRGRGRRRTIQAIYLTLAILMGGGLVLFGIGGDVQGGLFDAFSQGGGDAREQIEDRVEKAQERVKARPQDAGAWKNLAEAQYQLAGQSEGFNQDTGEFSGEAREQLVAAERSWDRHLQLAGDRADTDLAATMRTALLALNKPEKAVRAQEIVIDGLPDPGFGDYAQLAELAYRAGQSRKGDLAAQKAEELAPKDRKKDLREALQRAKTEALTQAAGGAGGTPAQPVQPSGG